MNGQARRGYIVSGRIQCVGFRWWTQKEADRLGLVGTVQNLEDGRVEVMARGTTNALEKLERLLREGPPMSRVKEIERFSCTVSDQALDFRVVRG